MSVTDSSKKQAKTGNYNPVELEKEVVLEEIAQNIDKRERSLVEKKNNTIFM